METETLKQTDSFKLIKNSRGYSWEIRISSDDLEIVKSKIQKMNNWANENFKSEDIEDE